MNHNALAVSYFKVANELDFIIIDTTNKNWKAMRIIQLAAECLHTLEHQAYIVSRLDHMEWSVMRDELKLW